MLKYLFKEKSDDILKTLFLRNTCWFFIDFFFIEISTSIPEEIPRENAAKYSWEIVTEILENWQIPGAISDNRWNKEK